jgi:predicted xylose isomerase-like sugar epimerase
MKLRQHSSAKNAKMIARLAKEQLIAIVNVNALQRWNQSNAKKKAEAEKFAEHAAFTGAKILIFVSTIDA